MSWVKKGEQCKSWIYFLIVEPKNAPRMCIIVSAISINKLPSAYFIRLQYQVHTQRRRGRENQERCKDSWHASNNQRKAIQQRENFPSSNFLLNQKFSFFTLPTQRKENQTELRKILKEEKEKMKNFPPSLQGVFLSLRITKGGRKTFLIHNSHTNESHSAIDYQATLWELPESQLTVWERQKWDFPFGTTCVVVYLKAIW